MNPALVGRRNGCWVCRHVAKTEDVTVRLFDEGGNRLPPKEAIEYLASIGLPGSPRAMAQRVARHAKHVATDLAHPRTEIAPINQGQIVPAAPVGGSPTWLRVNDQATDLGMDVFRELERRLPDMEDKDVISAGRLTLAASHKRGDWEAKGRSLSQVDSLLRIAAGLVEK